LTFKFSKIASLSIRGSRTALEPTLLGSERLGWTPGESAAEYRIAYGGVHTEESIDKFSGHRKQCDNNVNYAPGADRQPLQLIGRRARARLYAVINCAAWRACVSARLSALARKRCAFGLRWRWWWWSGPTDRCDV